MKTKTITLLAAFKQYINGAWDSRLLGTNAAISRQDLIKNILELKEDADEKTIDVYRAYFAKAGYLITQSHGMYIVAKRIEEDLTVSKLNTVGYTKT